MFLHGAGGLFGPIRRWRNWEDASKVFAPHLPGYGESTGSEQIDDVIDAALFYHQLMDDLHPDRLHRGPFDGRDAGGRSRRARRHRARKLVLVAPAGFWLDEHPIPDFFAAELEELHRCSSMIRNHRWPRHDDDPEDRKQMAAMYVERVKRLTMASKFLWPIPDRGLKKRAYRISAPTLLLWGASDRLIPPVYAKEFTKRIAGAKEQTIAEAGHMLPYEQNDAFCKAVNAFLK